MEWNPRALLVTLAAAVGLWLLVAPPWARQEPTAADDSVGSTARAARGLPNELPSGDITSVARSLGARAGYEYVDDNTPLRALVFVERPGWVAIVYYAGEGDTYTRIHGTYNPTGYDAPRLVGSPPLLAFHSQEMDVDFAYRLRDGEMVLEALGEATLEPAVAVDDPTLPGLMGQDVARDTAEE
jgi:hypothetical protein